MGDRNNTLKTPPYGNCKVLHPDGTPMFNCGLKKAKWYLNRNLAEIVQEEPLIVRLKFEPKGPGRANDKFYLQHRENICVGCGATDGLTKHHVVPTCYRKYFPEEYKNFSAYDILPLCQDCHEEYEVYANDLKDQICEEFSVPVSPRAEVDKKIKNVVLHATAIQRHGDRIPQERLEQLYGTLREYYQKQDVTPEEVAHAATLWYHPSRDDLEPASKLIVEQIKDYQQFVMRWRKHFLDHLNPQFMPEHWEIERPIDRMRDREESCQNVEQK